MGIHVAEIVYSGVVGAIHIHLQIIDADAGTAQRGPAPDSLSRLLGATHSDFSEETRLLNALMEQRSNLLEQVRQAVDDVDHRLEADSMVLQRGSVEVFVILSTAYTVITNFNEFIDVVYKTAENVRRVFRDVTAATAGSANFLATGQFKMDPSLQALAIKSEGTPAPVAAMTPSQPSAAALRTSWADLNTALLAVIVIVLVGILVVIGLRL